MNGIARQTFQDADEKTRFGILFDLQVGTAKDIKDIKRLIQKHPIGCEGRFKKLESRKLKDSALAISAGVITAVGTVAAKLKFWS